MGLALVPTIVRGKWHSAVGHFRPARDATGFFETDFRQSGPPASIISTAEPPQRFGRARAVVNQLGAGAAVLRGPACQGGQITLSYVQALLEDSPL